MANTTVRKRNILNKAKQTRRCMLCVRQVKHIDYKDVQLLQKHFSNFARILPRRYTGTCVYHQKMITNNIKRARLMGLLPYTIQHKQHYEEE